MPPLSDQGWDYRIEKLSNADISDFSVYRRVYRIEPPISSISIFSKPVIFLSFFVENSPKIQKIPRKFWKPMNQSPQQQQQQRRKFQKFAENSKNSKICRKFLNKKVFFEAIILYCYRIVSRKKPSYRIESKTSLSRRGGINTEFDIWTKCGQNMSLYLFHFQSNKAICNAKKVMEV